MIEKAIHILSERFEYSKKTFGCAHSESLFILREIIQMHWKLKTKETRIIVEKLLLGSIISIISMTKTSQLLYEAAKFIAKIYIDFELREEGRAKLIQIHRQVMANTCGYAHKNELKIDTHIGRSAYVFLVVFEELICGLAISSYTKIMADFLTETILWQSYSASLKSEKNIELMLSAGARLYVFLKKSSRKEQFLIVQTELHKRFIAKWGSFLKVKSEASLLFVTGLLTFLGSDTCQMQLGTAACKSSHSQVKELLLAKEYQSAYEVAVCSSKFLEHYGAYTYRQNMGALFKLSSLISLRDLKLPSTAMDPALHEAFLKLSRDIIGEVLKFGKQSNINFIRLKHDELNDLISLLGFQENYIELKVRLISLSHQLCLLYHVANNPPCSGFSRISGTLVRSKKRPPTK